MKNIKIFVLILVLSAFSSSSLLAGGWPQPVGNGYFKLFQWWVIADQHYTDSGLIDPNVTNAIYNTGLYGEYGLTKRVTGVVYFPFFSRAVFNNTISATTREIIDPGEAINSIGDTDVGVKYALTLNKPVALSATLRFGLPLGNAQGGNSGRLQTGDGEFNQLLQVDAGTGFKIGKINAYANAYMGVNNRTKGFSDEFHYGIEAGAGFFNNKLTGIVRFLGVKSFKNGSLNDTVNSTSIFANNSEHFSFSPELAYQWNDKWGVSVGYATALSGRIIFANPSYSVGVFFKLQ